MIVKINGVRYKSHRLIAEAFVPNPDNKPFVDHINRNKSDNRVFPVENLNLRWVTRSENCRNRNDHDRVEARGGTHWYENKRLFGMEKEARRRKNHKYLRFSDGKRRYIPNSEALLLLAIPVNQRIFIKK